jgi:histidinol dehydrogenase
MPILPIYTPEEARQGLLRRQPPEETRLPPTIQERLAELFGEATTPAQAVSRILSDVREQGDAALLRWTQTLDGAAPQNLRVPADELEAALHNLPSEQRAALELSIERVRRFHQHQPLSSWVIQDLGGTLGQIVRPIRRIGLYVPAGAAPYPSAMVMSLVPAQVAGVKEIALAAPPQHGVGKISPVILATAALLGVDEIYAMGGAQAIAALAFGTQSVRAVDKIFGPGNIFVTLAKRQVYGVVGIDNLAGPTETLVIADDSARPDWVAADLLAQAEHDVIASAILLTPSRRLAEAVQSEVERQAVGLSRRETFTRSIADRGGAVITRDLDEAIDLANCYGAEHLCLMVADPWRWVNRIECAGGIFLGEHSFEVLGDYVAGPSHVMPTGGSARFASPLNVLDFVHLISLIGLDEATATQIARQAAVIARAEGLDAHANAAEKRL